MSGDNQLIKRLASGDEKALEELIARYYGDILRYCSWHTPSRDWAEDAAQETFLKLIRYIDAYRHQGKFKAFLYKIAANVCRDLYRRREPWVEDGEDILSEAVDNSDDLAQTLADMQFETMLAGLDSAERELIILRFGQELSLREIGEVLDLPLRTVQSRLRTILKRMRKEWHDDEG